MLLFDIYNDVFEAIKYKKPNVIAPLDEYINFERIVPKKLTTRFTHIASEVILFILKAIFAP